MAQIGRNQPCPCGSGRKYKRCHGGFQEPRDPGLSPELIAYQRAMALHIQRERQQGQGKPIISGQLGGHRIVAVKNRLLHSKGWRTFHDFLFEYIKMAMGPDWGNAEIAKSLAERHPILVWHHYVCEIQRRYAKPGEVSTMDATGAVTAYLSLAYDLYALDHNAELQQKLVERLRHNDQFLAARYEVFVAAAMIRAGFTLAFENEDDRSNSHCEFTAIHSATGRQFSVEAKCRTENGKFRIGRQLCRSLKKQAAHERIVFIELNMPDVKDDTGAIRELERAKNAVRAFEGKEIDGQPLPAAYIFITNSPAHLHLDEVNIHMSALADGFQIPDFKADTPFESLRAAINARERHKQVMAIVDSIREYRDPPSTFDGEMPEFAFGAADPGRRILVGGRYEVPGPDGTVTSGTITSVTIAEAESTVYAGVQLDDGSAVICTMPLSEAEMNAWRRHPDTFFGQPHRRKQKVEDPLDLYDFFFDSYKTTPAARLLELLAQASDIEQLRGLTQPELASIYAERSTYGAMTAMQSSADQARGQS